MLLVNTCKDLLFLELCEVTALHGMNWWWCEWSVFVGRL